MIYLILACYALLFLAASVAGDWRPVAIKLGALKLWSITDTGRRIIASWHRPGQTRWRWALYHSRYAGYGLRLVNVYDATFRRRRMFVDSPLTGVFLLYIQDVP